MYKIMIADDEGIVIDALSYIIQKNFGQECMVESAKTGRKVIELAEHMRPDIAFMDIQMPGINGIEAMKEIQRTNRQIQFIVMTAYDKFDYAKEAANLGVLKFLNKPVNQGVVVDTIHLAMKHIDEQRRKRSEDLEIKEKLETVVPIIENGFIYSLLMEGDFRGDSRQYRNLLDIRQEFAYMMVIEWGELREGQYLSNPIGASVKAQAFSAELRESIQEFFDCCVGAVTSNKIAVYVPVETEGMEYNERIRIIERARNLAQKLMKRIDFQFRVGIGTVKRLEEAAVSYNEAVKALRFGKGRVNHLEDLAIGCTYEDNYPVEAEKLLFEMVQKGNAPKAKEQAGYFFKWMTENHAQDPMNIKLKVLEFVMNVEKLAFESGGMSYNFNYRSDYLETVLEYQGYDKLEKWFLEKIEDACRNVATKKEEQVSGVVEKAKRYIQENYSKDLSLDEVSRAVNISPYYFSKLFKEETGENFIEFLTSLRMETAKKMLADKDVSIKEICIGVGYGDPNYFSRIFKKSEGITPTEYREGLE